MCDAVRARSVRTSRSTALAVGAHVNRAGVARPAPGGAAKRTEPPTRAQRFTVSGREDSGPSDAVYAPMREFPLADSDVLDGRTIQNRFVVTFATL